MANNGEEMHKALMGKDRLPPATSVFSFCNIPTKKKHTTAKKRTRSHREGHVENLRTGIYGVVRSSNQYDCYMYTGVFARRPSILEHILYSGTLKRLLAGV